MIFFSLLNQQCPHTKYSFMILIKDEPSIFNPFRLEYFEKDEIFDTIIQAVVKIREVSKYFIKEDIQTAFGAIIAQASDNTSAREKCKCLICKKGMSQTEFDKNTFSEKVGYNYVIFGTTDNFIFYGKNVSKDYLESFNRAVNEPNYFKVPDNRVFMFYRCSK